VKLYKNGRSPRQKAQGIPSGCRNFPFPPSRNSPRLGGGALSPTRARRRPAREQRPRSHVRLRAVGSHSGGVLFVFPPKGAQLGWWERPALGKVKNNGYTSGGQCRGGPTLSRKPVAKAIAENAFDYPISTPGSQGLESGRQVFARLPQENHHLKVPHQAAAPWAATTNRLIVSKKLDASRN